MSRPGRLPGLAGPGAPVAARRDEVPMRSNRVRRGRRPVAVDATLARAHLEQAEVLAVLGLCAKAGLATRDGKGFAAVIAEHAADDVLRHCGLDGGEAAELRPV